VRRWFYEAALEVEALRWVDLLLIVVGLLVILLKLYAPDLGNPFSADVPRESWFQHRIQWDIDYRAELGITGPPHDYGG
jgi:hypothetical protein